MQDKIDCNKINEIREERMQTQFLYWFDKIRAYIQYSSNPLEIFHSLCKNPFTKSEPHRDNSSLVFRNPYNLRDPQSLNQSLWMRRKKEEFFLEQRILQLKFMEKLLIDLQVFAQEFLLREHLTMKFFWNLSHFLLRE